MRKLKVFTIVGTRPEIIRLSVLIKLLDLKTDHFLLFTGQNSNPNLSSVFFREMAIRPPDRTLDSKTGSLGIFLGSVLAEVEKELREVSPDAVLVLGDTYSALTCMVAKNFRIPIYHLEAGNRSFDMEVPEESNRRLIDHLADFNLPYSEFARNNLLLEGLNPRFIFKTGSPLREVYQNYAEEITGSRILDQLQLEPRTYLLVSLHRQETVDYSERVLSALQEIDSASKELEVKVVASVHPRLAEKANLHFRERFSHWVLTEPFGFFDYTNLQKNSYCVVSDSGSISEESAVGQFPAVTLRNSMERQEALELGVVPMVPIGSGTLVEAIRFITESNPPELPPDYMTSSFAQRVFSIMQSTAFVANRWTGRN